MSIDHLASLRSGRRPTMHADTLARAVQQISPATDQADTSSEAEGWTYRTEVDELRRSTATFAEIGSVDTVMLSAPYSGPARALIAVKSIGSFREVAFSVNHGRLNASETFSIQTRSGEGPISSWRIRRSKDGDMSVVLISHPVPFVRMLSNTRHLIVEVEFVGSGRRRFRFEPDGLDLGRLTGPLRF